MPAREFWAIKNKPFPEGWTTETALRMFSGADDPSKGPRWEFNSSKGLRAVRAEDRVLLYNGTGMDRLEKHFVASGRVKESADRVGNNTITLTDVRLFDPPVPLESLFAGSSPEAKACEFDLDFESDGWRNAIDRLGLHPNRGSSVALGERRFKFITARAGIREVGVSLPFEVHRYYRRKDLHDAFGGQGQGGISTPAGRPFLLLFTGESGRKHGYEDRWESDGSYRYFGEGQRGHMTMDAGNRALRDHAANGEDLHLFSTQKDGMVRYEGQMVCEQVEELVGVPDTDGNPRRAFVFRLRPLSDLTNDPGAPAPEESSSAQPTPSLSGLWDLPVEQLRELADAATPTTKGRAGNPRTVYERSEAVKVYVQRRAKGVCEGCGGPAPFRTRAGRPYLEPHHTRRMSDGGPDHRAWVVAICPTCHRRAHYADDGRQFNASLQERANRLENPQR